MAGCWLPLNFIRLVLEITPSTLFPCAMTGSPFHVPLPFPGSPLNPLAKNANWLTSRPLRGKSSSCLISIFVPKAFDVVSTSGVSFSRTSTVSFD